MIYGLSYFHLFTMITIITTNSIMSAHTNKNKNQHHIIHHMKSKYNYAALFMDKIMKTEYVM